MIGSTVTRCLSEIEWREAVGRVSNHRKVGTIVSRCPEIKVLPGPLPWPTPPHNGTLKNGWKDVKSQFGRVKAVSFLKCTVRQSPRCIES